MSRIADVLQKSRRERERNATPPELESRAHRLPPMMDSVAVPWQLGAQQASPPAAGIAKKPRAVPDELEAQVRKLFLTAGADGSLVHRVLISGADHSERTGEVVRQVAEGLAQLSMGSVCLVDLDVRRPTLTRRFHLEGQLGFSDAAMDAESPLTCVHAQPSLPGLSVMPAGTRTADVVSRLGTRGTLAWLGRSLGAFDYVIALVATIADQRDALMLSSAFDGVVLVAEAGVTDPEAVRRAAKVLKSADVRLLGTFITNR